MCSCNFGSAGRYQREEVQCASEAQVEPDEAHFLSPRRAVELERRGCKHLSPLFVLEAQGFASRDMRRFQAPSSNEEDTSSSEDATATESESSPSSDSPPGQVRRSDLLISQMQAFVGDDLQANDSAAAVSGRDKERVKRAMGKKCQCSRKCMRRLNLRQVMSSVILFWSLSKSAQDCLLWTMQASHSAERGCSDDSEESDSCETSDQSSRASRSRSPRRMHSWFIQGSIAFHFTHLSPGVQVCREAFLRIMGL